MNKLFACLRDEEGATAIEYGLIAGLVAAVLIVAVGAVGPDLTEMSQYVGVELDGARTE
jgi:pilus assembly protein Flp/PilA